MKKMNLWDKLVFYGRTSLHALFSGLKGADALLTSNQKPANGSGIEIPDEGGGGVYKDMLEQKVTKEVEEVRYTSYKVANESKKYRYVGNGEAVKKTSSELTEKHTVVDESDNNPIVLIQDNSLITEGVLETIKEVDKKKDKKIKSNYIVKINRDFIPRFFLEQYLKKVVVKSFDEDRYILDLYFSMYPRQFSARTDSFFLNEIKKIKDEGVRSDLFDIKSIGFVTFNAWGSEDYREYLFEDCELLDIITFDGNYVAKTLCSGSIINNDLLEKVYSKSAEDKYKNKAVKKGGAIILPLSNEKNDFIVPGKNHLEKVKNVNFSIENDLPKE